jgi:hypothetical protein
MPLSKPGKRQKPAAAAGGQGRPPTRAEASPKTHRLVWSMKSVGKPALKSTAVSRRWTASAAT